MTTKSLPELAKDMRDLDITMLFTHAEDGNLAGRPMSNNGDVEYAGDSFYFTWSHAKMVKDIERNAKVALSFQGSKGLLGKPPLMVAVEGEAEVIRDKAAFAEHWVPDLERWFEDGVETPGLAMIRVHASRIHYWHGEDEGELTL